ncbi:MAG: HIT domain-containing protein [Acidimicrobiia bacterium]
MSLDRLWAGWRTSYIETIATQEPSHEPEGCVLCRLADANDPEGLILERNDLTFAVMNAYPYTSGHLMVSPVRHVAALEELSPEEATELMAMLQRATTAVRAAYDPDGMNVGINVGRGGGAGVPGHLHVHVLPRWAGDTNFMTAVAEVRVLPEALTRSWEKLQAAWPAG